MHAINGWSQRHFDFHFLQKNSSSLCARYLVVWRRLRCLIWSDASLACHYYGCFLRGSPGIDLKISSLLTLQLSWDGLHWVSSFACDCSGLLCRSCPWSAGLSAANYGVDSTNSVGNAWDLRFNRSYLSLQWWLNVKRKLLVFKNCKLSCSIFIIRLLQKRRSPINNNKSTIIFN